MCPFLNSNYYQLKHINNYVLHISCCTYIQCTNDIFFLAAGASRLISVESENATTIEAVWSAPIALEQNGNISSFLIEVINSNISSQFNQTFEVNLLYPISNSTTFNQNVSVDAGFTYTVTVRAMNGAGLGERSESLGVTTPEAGNELFPITIVYMYII